MTIRYLAVRADFSMWDGGATISERLCTDLPFKALISLKIIRLYFLLFHLKPDTMPSTEEVTH